MDNANIQSKIKELKTYIKESLKEYPNFIGVDVHNLAPSEEDSLWIIQGKNKQVQGYYYGEFIQFKESKLISIKAIFELGQQLAVSVEINSKLYILDSINDIKLINNIINDSIKLHN